mgnify:FL=1
MPESFYFNSKQRIDFCTKYNCTTDQIGKGIKASITNATFSPFYRELLDSGSGSNGDKMKSIVKRLKANREDERNKEIIFDFFDEFFVELTEYAQKQKGNNREALVNS